MDKKAKEILFKTYWSNEGWKNEYTVASEDFIYAREKGIMFDPLTISHDDCIKKVIEIVKSITLEQVVKAFLSSLSTRKLELRSGIASYHIAQLLTFHKYTPKISGYSFENGKPIPVSFTCDICEKSGIYALEHYQKEDLNVLNFERIKWGGVRHEDLLYLFFDLEQFQKEEVLEPTKGDIEIFKNILKVINSCKKGDFPSVLRDKLKDIPNFKSNKNEREVIIEILASIEILKPMSYDRPIRGRNDWEFIEYWRGEDGYDSEVVEKYFGKYLK